MNRVTKQVAKLVGINPVAWIRNTFRMHARIKAFAKLSPNKGSANIRFAIIITPWQGTSVPWFTLAVGLLLAKEGNDTVFVLDGFPFGDRALRYKFVLFCLNSAMRLLRRSFDVVKLSSDKTTKSLDASAHSCIANLAELNAIWELRGEMLTAGRRQFIARSVQQLSAAYTPIAEFLRDGKFEAIFVPGGVYGTSGIWVEHARANNIRINSFDAGGYGTAMFACDGIACRLQDIPSAYRLLTSSEATDAARSFAIATALAELDQRRAGLDIFASQIKGTGGADSRYDGAILIALNSSWDAAALGLHTVFDNNMQWIVETTRYLLAETTATVIVRQHPAERLEIAHTSDNYRELLNSHFGSNPRIIFIAADEAINSYYLLDRVAAIVAYTSTIGIEAAALGKPVVTQARSYYSDLGFVWKATRRKEYEEYLKAAACGELRVTSEMRVNAQLCYYLTQCCNWVFSPFNPSDMHEWSRMELVHWQRNDSVRRVLQSIQNNIPVSYLNHVDKHIAELAKSSPDFK